MPISGFRLPQFSEDSAYLPPWLQNPQFEASSNSFRDDPQSNFSQVETLSREEGRLNSFKLFLSGDDTSQTSLHSSPGNVLHLRLHLSSDGESQDSHSKSIDASKPREYSSQRVETSADLQERLRQSEGASDHDEAVENSPLFSPMAVENACPQSSLPALECVNISYPTDCEESRVHGEKSIVRNMEESEVSEAVELSIAASEALVIHELMKTESPSEILQTDVLEAALRVKQARLEAIGDGIAFSSHDNEDIDFLSDLDDLTMESAIKDIGLYFEDLDGPHDCFDVSLVKDTPMSENLNVHNDEPGDVQLMDQQDKICGGSALGLNNCVPVDPILDHPTEKISNVLYAGQPQANASSSPACLSENTGEKEVCSSVNKFRSRWLGGWAVKGAVVPAKMKQNRGIPRFFHCETSSLSESGVAADENSFVQNHETGSKIASQSSRPFEGVLEKVDEGNLISQEVRSSNQSFDPLCSVVPCSISTENSDLPSVQNQDDEQKNSFTTKLELGKENFLNVVDLDNEFELVDREALPAINRESSDAPVRRKLASLKTYSKLSPKHDVTVNGQRISRNQGLSSECGGELVSSNQNEPGQSGSCKKNSNLPLFSGGGYEQNQEVFGFGVPANHDEPAEPANDGAELVLQPPVQRTSPRILNRKGRCRLHPSELLVESSAGKRSLELRIARGTQCKDLKENKFQNMESKLKNPHSAPNATRKRVHFTEVGMEHHYSKDIQKPETAQRNCSSVRANKKPKYSKSRAGSWARDMKNILPIQTNEKTLIFHRKEFLLTGFSKRKEREIVRLINEYGGMVLSDIPSPPSSLRSRRSTRSNFNQLPIIISLKKLQTAKFLYGCAVNALILKVKWLADSVAAGSCLPPEKYMILPNRTAPPYPGFGKSYNNNRHIFDRVGIMLHGKPSFFTKSAIIIKHGGGQVFKTLQRLFKSRDAERLSVGAIIAEDESKVSRHLKHCAAERNLSILPASWMAKSLHLGKLLPFEHKKDILTMTTPHSTVSIDWSQEI